MHWTNCSEIPFFIDDTSMCRISYGQLIDDLNKSNCFDNYCQPIDYYEFFKNLILSLILDFPVTVFDHVPLNEIIRKEGQENIKTTILKEKWVEINNTDDLIQRIRGVKKWRITLFTSGTTGQPQKVIHTLDDITRVVKQSVFHKNDIWAFAYNPSHIAGIQVFFQALFNVNPLVRVFGFSRDKSLEMIRTHKITHISATPTFFRLLLPIHKPIFHIKRVTSGGEKINAPLIEKIKLAFPRAKFLNLYASTEFGTIMSSMGETFEIGMSVANKIKIENSQIYMNKSMLTGGESREVSSTWQPTGDLVEIVSKSPLRFRFSSRTTDRINVGGYLVNLCEVEDAIHSINGVKDVRVYSKPNSVIGNILCAEVVRIEDNLTVSFIRSQLSLSLTPYKIPRIIDFVDLIRQTNTGKKTKW